MELRPFQVVLTVSDLARSAEFYSQFGFTPGNRVCKDDGRERLTLRSPKSDFELKLFSNPNPLPLDAGRDLLDYLTRIGTRYLSLLCEDVDEFYARNKSKMRFIRPPTTGMTGCRYTFFADPDGILLEAYQPGYEQGNDVQQPSVD